MLLLTSAPGAQPDLEATLRERLAALVFVLPVPAQGEAIYPSLSGQLFPGQLPEYLPFPVPAVPDGRLVGSMAATPAPHVVMIELVYEATGDERVLLDSLEHTLLEQEYTPTENREGQGLARRVAPGRTLQSRAYCASASGPWLSVIASPLDAGLIDVRIRYFSHPSAAACAPSAAVQAGATRG
jgi:hypothetical protein